jgi:hypothetical protein
MEGTTMATELWNVYGIGAYVKKFIGQADSEKSARLLGDSQLRHYGGDFILFEIERVAA